MAAVALAGCGTSPTGSAPASTPVSTPAPLDLGFASFTFRMDMGDGDVLQGSGAFRNAPSRVTQLSLESMVVDGKVQPSAKVIRTGTATYLQSGEWVQRTPLLAGKWLKVTAKNAGLDLAYLDFLASYEGLADPYEQLQMLQSGTVEIVGPEQVGDVAAVHKRSTATFNQVWMNPRVSHKIRDGLRAAGLDEADFLTPNTFDAWVDSNGRIVKFEMSDPAEGPEPLFVTRTSFDQDRIATLSAPAPELVVDRDTFTEFGRLIKKMQSGKATAAEVARARRLNTELGFADANTTATLTSI